MKDKDVLIKIKGSQKHEEGFKDEIDVFTVGKLRKAGTDIFEIVYMESDDSFPPGVTTTLSVGPEIVTISRDLTPNGRMTVEKGQRHLCHYETGFGSMMVGVFGEKIFSSLKEDGGEISMKYTVDINSALTTENEIHITVRESPAEK